MRRFRTISRSGYRSDVCGWLVIALLTGGVLPTCAYAQNKDESPEPAQVPTGEVRGAVTSGLGERKLSQSFPDAALWLDLADGARTLALLWPEREAPARGGLLILADEGGNPESGLTGALARELAHRNFAVLTLGLESPPLAIERILERPVTKPGLDTEPYERGPEATSPATIDVLASDAVDELEVAYRSRIREQLVAGVAALKARDYELVAVVGIGRGSNHIVLYAAELGGSPALIWVAPKLYPQDSEKLAVALEGASVPRILELSSSDEREQRRAGLKRARVEGFSLQLMGSGDLLSPRNGKTLAGRISAWLNPK
ncbi:Protein of unknown function [Marinobacter sp. LV10R510-11A]|uniref:DUF3530 family protein n=1 Tax=Marinobacter sp. LV10R510-11A TaxID=1415568 RepID=UPI000BC0673B|nr:DUF3530 family protein [Marinobacter sp. LV10R510-11A]SOB77745.1 Protein of unknown function [Marinobacter sp. LV10R510-11A]